MRELAVYEDARHWANLAMWSIELQLQRLSEGKLEIPEFEMQPLSDFHFLMTSLNRLRKSAELVSKVSDLSDAISNFDTALPWLKRLRNVLEHIDEYRVRLGRDRSVKISSLQVFSFGYDHIEWIDERVEFKNCREASSILFRAIQNKLPQNIRNGT